MKIWLLGFVILAFISETVSAGWTARKQNLEKMHKVGEIRVFYSLKGKDALPSKNQVDDNNNNIPDYVENISLRLQSALILYTEVFGMMHPLESPRYKSQNVKYIDVHILNRDSKGSTGDGVHHYKYKNVDTEHVKSIAMRLSTNLRDGTLTTVHEMFHIIQNGYTMFKNVWYTEGTARWSEYAFAEGTGTRKKLPKTKKDLDALVKESYRTRYFWRRLAYNCDQTGGQFELPDIAKVRITKYPPVFEDNKIYGYGFMRTFLENLGKMDKVASKKRGLNTFKWKEKIQKGNPKNNVYVFCALQKTIDERCSNSKRLAKTKKFQELLDSYTDNQCHKLLSKI